MSCYCYIMHCVPGPLFPNSSQRRDEVKEDPILNRYKDIVEMGLAYTIEYGHNGYTCELVSTKNNALFRYKRIFLVRDVTEDDLMADVLCGKTHWLALPNWVDYRIHNNILFCGK